MPGRRNLLKRDRKSIQQFLGRWKVEDAIFECFDDDSSKVDETADVIEPTRKLLVDFTEDVKGVHFTLDEQYDITWHVPEGRKDIPLFSTNAFDVDEDELELLGAVDGAAYVFQIVPLEDKVVHLKCPASPTISLSLMLYKVNEETDSVFSLIDALRECYFSDLSIQSKNGDKFAVHRLVLCAASPHVKCHDWEMSLPSLSSKALKATLHFVYTSTLPTNITEDTAKEILEMAKKSGKMNYLKELSSIHIESYRLKMKLLELVDGILCSLDIAKQLVEATDMSDPPKTLYAIKQLAKEAAIAISKLALLSHLYTMNKQKMTKPEKREVLEYVQARVVVCLDQGKELLQLVLSKWEGLTQEQKKDAAVYIIPEVERIWGLLNTHAAELHQEVAKITKKGSSLNVLDVNWKATAALQFSTKLKDMKRLKKLNKEFDNFVRVGTDKREWFMRLSEEEKVDRILRVILELSQDGEELISKFEEAKKKILLANALDWNSYKLAISVACSYMSWSMNKLLHLKSTIKPILKSVCNFIGSEDVNYTLVYLSLLEPLDLVSGSDDSQVPVIPSILNVEKHSLYQVNQLALGCTHLLESQEMCDMQFIVLDPSTPTSDENGHPLHKESIDHGCIVIKAHRVILAARSEWFRRALQSGMIEDRDRRIVIQDIEESLFRTFLEYLYGKTLDFTEMKIHELMELLAVADRYETLSLRRLCEGQLVSKVTDVNVFHLLTQAEQFNIRKLRESTLNHILSNPDLVITQVDAYSNLPSELKQEVRQILSGTQEISHFTQKKHKISDTFKERVYQGEMPDISNKDISPSFPESTIVDDVNSATATTSTTCSSFSVIESDTHMMLALEQVRMVVGNEPSDDDLKSLLIAADMDINRAANYFFGIDEA